MSVQMSTKDFKAILTETMTDICSREGFNFNKSADRGYAFQYFTADLIFGAEDGFDGEPNDVMLFSRDLGSDLVFEDSANRLLLICQCKYTTPQGTVRESDVSAFFNRHEMYQNRQWVRKHGSAEAQNLLLDYADRLANGWTIDYRFITTAKATEKLRAIAETESARYEAAGEAVSCTMVGFSELKAYYVRSLSLDQTIPDRVEMNLPRDRYIEKQSPYPTVIALLKGNELRNIYNQHKQSLYAYNTRGYLGARGVNESISRTAEEEPENFLYFNNGVSAICTSYELVGNRLSAENFQIINGAQTVTSLSRVEPSSDVEVLFRLTRTLDVKTEKGINEKIIRFNNSQNAIKLSDFRSNDPIQVFLERNLITKRAQGPLPKLSYVRKRGSARRGRDTGVSVRLEELAKIRYAFLHEPTLLSSNPRSLWTSHDEGGAYEKAFGVDGALSDAWPSDVVDEAFLVIAMYQTVVEDFRSRGRENPNLKYLYRLRFHARSLAAEAVRQEIARADYGSIARSNAQFDKAFGEVWGPVRQSLSYAHAPVDDGEVTMYALVRSGDRWKRMLEFFVEQLELR